VLKKNSLYVLSISLGSETRTLVAGLKDFFSKEDLLNRQIIVVTNLKPAKIRGVESNGMLLTAEKGGRLALLSAPKAITGDGITAESLQTAEKQITIDKFYALDLSVEGKRVFYKEHILKTAKDEIVAAVEDGAKIK